MTEAKRAEVELAKKEEVKVRVARRGHHTLTKKRSEDVNLEGDPHTEVSYGRAKRGRAC